MTSRSGYVLSTGDAGAARLRLLQRVVGRHTELALRTAGLQAGYRAVDIGCGAGTVTRQIAEIVGPGGRVTGVDISPAQIAVAQNECADLAHVSFGAGSADRTGLPGGTFDFAYCRFVLCHLTDPAAAIAEMCRLLRPGGVLLCEDHEISTLTTLPPTNAYREAARLSAVIATGRGTDSDIGPKLPALLRAGGLREVRASAFQEAFYRGEEKRIYEWTVEERIPKAAAAGLVDAETQQACLAAMRAVNDDESVLAVMPRIWQVWGTRR